MLLYGWVSAEILLGATLIGAGIGLLSGAFGKGGSALATPLLHVIGVPAIVAVASPLPATIPATLLASRVYARERGIDGRVFRLALAAGIPATIVGALSTRWIPGGGLILATDVLVLLLGMRVLLRAQDGTPEVDPAPASLLRVTAIVAVVG